MFRSIDLGAKCRHDFGSHAQGVLPCYPDPLDALAIGGRFGVGPCDPSGLPVFLVKKACFPPGSICSCSLSGGVPHAYSPVIALAGFESRPSVSDTDGLPGGDFAAVPNIAMTGFQAFRTTCHQDLIGRLPPVALGVVTLPRQAGF